MSSTIGGSIIFRAVNRNEVRFSKPKLRTCDLDEVKYEGWGDGSVDKVTTTQV